VISSALKKRFPDHDIINVTGVRRQESSARAKMPVSAPQASLQRRGKAGLTWNAIIEWPVQQVVACVEDRGLDLHEAYTRYGTSRVSCAWCIMGSGPDLLAAADCADNHALYCQMVELEAESTFAFQGSRWLADVAPDLLSRELRERVARAKAAAKERQEIEAEIPKHLLYTAGWPTEMPTPEEAEVIASVRRRVGALLGVTVECTTVETVLARYADLMAQAAAKRAA
jgi:3'-phosphoadenosine 5'-phosphosulfate sulfotransferase (PAPS reductase)/FAD synthetase